LFNLVCKIEGKYIIFYSILYPCSDSLYEEDEDLEDEGEDGGSSSYLDSSSGPPPPETNNNLLRLSPGGSPAAPTPTDKMTSSDLHHQADSSTERDPNDSEGKKIRGTYYTVRRKKEKGDIEKET
jgi:hypothetical protein